jgi:hypothetical protein
MLDLQRRRPGDRYIAEHTDELDAREVETIFLPRGTGGEFTVSFVSE